MAPRRKMPFSPGFTPRPVHPAINHPDVNGFSPERRVAAPFRFKGK
jgi:hypothetical protein